GGAAEEGARGQGDGPHPPGLREAGGDRPRVHTGRHDGRGRRIRRSQRDGRRSPRGGAPGADPQPAARSLPEQPDGRLQHPGGGDPLRRPPLREHLQRDGSGLLLPRARVPAGLRAGGRGAPHKAAGPVRDRQALQRAAHGRGHTEERHPLHLHPPLVGAARGELRAQPRSPGEGRVRPLPELLELHRRLRPRRRYNPGRRVRPAGPRGLLHSLARQRGRAAVRGDREAVLRRRGGGKDPPVPRRRRGDLDRQGREDARLQPEALLARLPGRGGQAQARCWRGRLLL
ncbi:MAG: UDP-glucose 4-epimerase, partial [uncultured Rubrobacteraceae bacterium]